MSDGRAIVNVGKTCAAAIDDSNAERCGSEHFVGMGR